MRYFIVVLALVLALVSFSCAGGGYYTPIKEGATYAPERSTPVTLSRGKTATSHWSFYHKRIYLWYDVTRTQDDILKADLRLDKKGRYGSYKLAFLITDDKGKVVKVVRKKVHQRDNLKFYLETPYFPGMRIGSWIRGVR